MDFIYYAQVINAEKLNDDMKALYKERVLANRRSSAQLSAAIQELPVWYLGYLRTKRLSARRSSASSYWISNTTEYDAADKKENAIRRHLGLEKQNINLFLQPTRFPRG